MTDLTTLMRDSAEQIPTGPPPYAAIRRQARRRRGVTWGAGIAAAASLAAVAGSVHLVDTMSPSAPTRGYDDEVPVFLDNSSFEVGVDRPFGDATMSGELHSEQDDRCLLVGDSGTPIFWPQGWEGLTHGADGFTLLDQDGKTVAEAGDTVDLRGIITGPAEWGGDNLCEQGVTKAFMVTSLVVE